jgi:hypothetical protein
LFFLNKESRPKNKNPLFSQIQKTHSKIECIATFNTEQKEILYFTLVDILYSQQYPVILLGEVSIGEACTSISFGKHEDYSGDYQRPKSN